MSVFFSFLLRTLIFRFMLHDLNFDAVKCEFQASAVYTVDEIDTDIYSLPRDFGKTTWKCLRQQLHWPRLSSFTVWPCVILIADV